MEIGNLRALEQKINATNIKCPGVVGGGSSIQELENIGKMYQTIHTQLAALVLSTVSFMENVPIWHYRMPNEQELPVLMKELGLTEKDLDSK